MRLIVDDHDVLETHEVGHHPLNHLALGLQRARRVAGAPLKERAAGFADLEAVAPFEGVIVGDDDLGFLHLWQKVAGH
jgi:hypothetical protein